LEDTDPTVRVAAIDAIGKIKDRDAVDPLIHCLSFPIRR
jgi:HEAT repeat protein